MAALRLPKLWRATEAKQLFGSLLLLIIQEISRAQQRKTLLGDELPN